MNRRFSGLIGKWPEQGFRHAGHVFTTRNACRRRFRGARKWSIKTSISPLAPPRRYFPGWALKIKWKLTFQLS